MNDQVRPSFVGFVPEHRPADCKHAIIHVGGETGRAQIKGLPSGIFVRIIRSNTPAMPLYDAHFGGFFTSGDCQ